VEALTFFHGQFDKIAPRQFSRAFTHQRISALEFLADSLYGAKLSDKYTPKSIKFLNLHRAPGHIYLGDKNCLPLPAIGNRHGLDSITSATLPQNCTDAGPPSGNVVVQSLGIVA
jgi:hypothetical protein